MNYYSTFSNTASCEGREYNFFINHLKWLVKENEFQELSDFFLNIKSTKAFHVFLVEIGVKYQISPKLIFVLLLRYIYAFIYNAISNQ